MAAKKTSKRLAKVAKKAPVKVAAKKAVAKDPPAKKVAAKKAVAQDPPAKKVRAKKVAAKKVVAKKVAKKAASKRGATKPVLLSGGNPQIAKADGDAPVQAYIAAMPGWKSEAGRRFDALVVRAVPDVVKAVKWNSPLYGIEGQGWFLGIHTFTNYIKVAFFQGMSLTPLPPGKSKDANTRYLDIREDDELDEEQVTSWIRQAAELPGWVP